MTKQCIKTVHHEIEAAASKSAEVRDNRGMCPGEVAHQGDVYVIRVGEWDDLYSICMDFRRSECGKRTSYRQLAPGTTKGSRHVAEGDGLTVFAPAKGADALEGPRIEASEEWCLAHPEHADHVFGPGKYCVTYQRDFASEERTRVVD